MMFHCPTCGAEHVIDSAYARAIAAAVPGDGRQPIACRHVDGTNTVIGHIDGTGAVLPGFTYRVAVGAAEGP